MANKFRDILLCTDLDETLLTTGDKRLTEENRNAIERFMSEGGYFTFATGRGPAGARLLLDIIKPNAPLICYNGGAIYDFNTDTVIKGECLDKQAIKVVEYVEENFPDVGIEVCTDKNIYFCKENRIAEMHRLHEHLPHITLSYKNVFTPWKKVIFLCEPEQMRELSTHLYGTEFADRYDFVQSFDTYFELMPKGVSKGSAMLELAQMLKISPKRTIGIGDNYNDIELIKNAGIGIAVANAVPEARAAADIITVDNNKSAIAAVIYSLELGRISFN